MLVLALHFSVFYSHGNVSSLKVSDRFHLFIVIGIFVVLLLGARAKGNRHVDS